MNGVIILNKPKGKTSHDMVYFVRRLFGIRRVGHTGTLDPNATGVLPICIGNATKAADYIQNSKKKYRAEIIFGKQTDTLDCTGKEINTGNVDNVDIDCLKKACDTFLGDIEQIPPMYSAVKVNGRKLYELARKGEEIERKSRNVSIYSIDICEFDNKNKRAIIDIECSKGTYVRTLCDDIGKKIGSYAYMGELTRTYSGGFSIEKSYSVSELEKMNEEGTLMQSLIKTEDIYFKYPKIILDKTESFKVRNGVQITKEGLENELYRLYDENGEFLCVSHYDEGKLVMQTSFWG